MRRLPDDFNVNILLPGAVWLLISILVGRVAVSRLQTDAMTVVMFVVISLVIFIVPMAVYMEYRKKIEQLSERKSKRHLPSRRLSVVPRASHNRPQNRRQHVGLPFHRISRMP